MIDQILTWLLGLPPVPLYAALATLAATENIFPPIPADTAVALGAFLASQGSLSWSTVFGVTWGANVASATAVYVGARMLGRPFFEGRLGRRLLSPRVLAHIERQYQRHGSWGIFLSRLLPGWRAVVAPFAGIVGLPARRALLPLYVASALWYGLLTYLVYRLGGTLEQAVRFVAGLNRGLAIVAVVLAVALGWWIWRHARRRKS